MFVVELETDEVGEDERGICVVELLENDHEVVDVPEDAVVMHIGH